MKQKVSGMHLMKCVSTTCMCISTCKCTVTSYRYGTYLCTWCTLYYSIWQMWQLPTQPCSEWSTFLFAWLSCSAYACLIRLQFGVSKESEVKVWVSKVTSSELMYVHNTCISCLSLPGSVQGKTEAKKSLTHVQNPSSLASHRMATQCVCIIEVIKLSC